MTHSRTRFSNCQPVQLHPAVASRHHPTFTMSAEEDWDGFGLHPRFSEAQTYRRHTDLDTHEPSTHQADLMLPLCLTADRADSALHNEKRHIEMTISALLFHEHGLRGYFSPRLCRSSGWNGGVLLCRGATP